jgi:hypothetical protein
MSTSFRSIRPEEHTILAEALGDTPETFISVHILTRSLGRAYVAGDVRCFEAAVVQERDYPNEMMGFGADAAALSRLLGLVEGWRAVEVKEDIAPKLGRILEARTGSEVRYYRDVFHVPTRPVAPFTDERVRLLSPNDLELLETSCEGMRGSGWGSGRALLEEGVMAGAVVEGRLVANAFTSARTAKHADVAVNTLEGWRNRGLATAAASLVAREVQQAGQTPVWSCGEDNLASLAVARKLGFVPVSHKTYVIRTDGGER